MKSRAIIVNYQPRVNAFPPDMEASRLEQLLVEYRERLRSPRPDGAPAWYLRGAIEAIEASLNDQADAA
jgi:hypothetical protein